MFLPSPVCGRTTETVGYFETDASSLAAWLVDTLSSGYGSRSALASSLKEVCAPLMKRRQRRGRFTLMPVDGWTAMLTDGPLGTDLGVLPIHAATRLGCRALRVVAAEQSSERYGATILVVYDPAMRDKILRDRRTIAAVDEGGRWVFDNTLLVQLALSPAALARAIWGRLVGH